VISKEVLMGWVESFTVAIWVAALVMLAEGFVGLTGRRRRGEVGTTFAFAVVFFLVGILAALDVILT
jgi:hypothetical protein